MHMWLDRLERAAGRWTIPHFPLFIVVANGLIYILGQMEPTYVYQLLLEPDAVRAGQWWRVMTFLFVPPGFSTLGMLFWLYLLFIYSQALEHVWGEFRFQIFIALGAAATAATSIGLIDAPLGNMALYASMFLAFAALYPESEMLLFFVLPVKVKYLGLVAWILTGWTFLRGDSVVRAGILASLFNYAIFFGPDLLQTARLKWQVYRNRRRWPR